MKVLIDVSAAFSVVLKNKYAASVRDAMSDASQVIAPQLFPAPTRFATESLLRSCHIQSAISSKN